MAERLRRGKIDVFVNQEPGCAGGALPSLNEPLAAAYVALFGEMRQRFALAGEIPLSLLVNQRDVIVSREEDPAEGTYSKCLEIALTKALENAEQMRLAEGEALCKDMEARLLITEDLLLRIEERSPCVAREWQGKLLERLARLAPDISFDPQRVAQEIAIYADRCEITEEVVRFRSHLQQFRLLLAVAEPVGRQIDFLVQELNREANTMGSKSNDADLTRLVVSLKAELEKIREQVQNVE